MEDVMRMLRAIANGQSAMKQELTREIKKVNKRVEDSETVMKKGFSDLEVQVEKIDKKQASM